MKKNQKNGYVVVEKALVGHSPELTGVSPDMNEEDLALLGFGVFPSQGLAEAKIETAFPKRKQSLFGVGTDGGGNFQSLEKSEKNGRDEK